MKWILVAVIVVLALIWLLGLRAKKRLSAAHGRPVWFPDSYDLGDRSHVVLMDRIREEYASVLADNTGDFTNCIYRPASTLPYPKEEIAKALTVLLDFAEGRRDSTLLDSHVRTPGVTKTVKASLAQLDNFLDVPSSEIPQEPRANAAFGARFVRGSS